MRSTVPSTRTNPSRRSLQEGQAIVLIALLILVLFGMLGLSVDSGRAYVDRRDQQTAVDAAALGRATGTRTIPTTPTLSTRSSLRPSLCTRTTSASTQAFLPALIQTARPASPPTTSCRGTSGTTPFRADTR